MPLNRCSPCQQQPRRTLSPCFSLSSSWQTLSITLPASLSLSLSLSPSSSPSPSPPHGLTTRSMIWAHSNFNNCTRRPVSFRGDPSSLIVQLLLLAVVAYVCRATTEWRWTTVLHPILTAKLGANKLLLTSSSKCYPLFRTEVPDRRHAFLSKNDKLCEWIRAKQSLILR